MSANKLYLLFSVAQYVHWRTDERLNVGIVVFDPSTRSVHAHMDSGDATRRVKQAFPDVDRVGLQMYLQDLSRGLPSDSRIRDSISADRPLEVLEQWQNMVRFTSPKPFPADSVASGITRLKHIYLEDAARTNGLKRNSGIIWAKKRTNEAITKVLNPIEGFDLKRDVELKLPYESNDERHSLPMKFPFLLMDRVVIDTLAFESESVERSQMYAHHFIQKVEELKNADSRYIPRATVAISKRNPESARSMIDYVRERTNLPEWAVTEADDAEVMLEHIRQELKVA